MIKIALKPHPATTEGGHDMIDIYGTKNGEPKGAPWTMVHVDLFWDKNNKWLYNALYQHGKTVVCHLTPVEDLL